MQPSPISAPVAKLLGEIWSYYRHQGDWPTRRWCMVWLAKQGLTGEEIESPASLRRTNAWSGGDDERIQPTFEELLSVEDYRRLVAPIPEVLCLAVAAVLSIPPFNDPDPSTDRPKVSREDLFPLWPDEETAYWGFRAIMLGPFRLSGGYASASDRSHFTFGPSVFHLRYEGVRSLEEALKISEQFDPGDPLSGPFEALPRPHRTLISGIYAHLCAGGAWPVAVPADPELSHDGAHVGLEPKRVEDQIREGFRVVCERPHERRQEHPVQPTSGHTQAGSPPTARNWSEHQKDKIDGNAAEFGQPESGSAPSPQAGVIDAPPPHC